MRKNENNGDSFWALKIIASLLFLIFTVNICIPGNKAVNKTEKSTNTASFGAENMNFINTQGVKAPERESTTEDEGTEPEQPAEPFASGEFRTPEDVLQFEKEYLAEFASVSPVGTVEEVFFKTSGATDIVNGLSIKNATATKKPDFEALLEEGPVLSVKEKSQPTVLIFHTHTTESYLLSDNGVFYDGFETRSFDAEKNMIRIGDEISRVLTENGIGVIHDENIYDESYNGAYSRSRVTVEKYLEEYPTIEIVLDVHRDAIYYSDTSHCKPTAEIDGKKAAQIMIITGAEEGYITDFPYWEDNLRFALCFQKTAEESFPGLMKPLYFCQRKYNMDTAKCSLLLEIGTDANTLEEALYSAHLTGKILTEIINESMG